MQFSIIIIKSKQPLHRIEKTMSYCSSVKYDDRYKDHFLEVIFVLYFQTKAGKILTVLVGTGINMQCSS